MKLDPFDKVVKKRNGFPLLILGGAGLLGLILAAFFWLMGDIEKPQVTIAADSVQIGLDKQVSFEIKDAKSGLRSIEVALVQENKKVLLFGKTYPGRAI